jgi:hypothetical protein
LFLLESFWLSDAKMVTQQTKKIWQLHYRTEYAAAKASLLPLRCELCARCELCVIVRC